MKSNWQKSDEIFGNSYFIWSLCCFQFLFCLFTFVLTASLLVELIMTIASSGYTQETFEHKHQHIYTQTLKLLLNKRCSQGTHQAIYAWADTKKNTSETSLRVWTYERMNICLVGIKNKFGWDEQIKNSDFLFFIKKLKCVPKTKTLIFPFLCLKDDMYIL